MNIIKAHDSLSLLQPRQIGELGGLLGERFTANRLNRLRKWHMVEQFLEYYINYSKSGEWFWHGEQIGKWLEAATFSALIDDDGELESAVHRTLDRLLACQMPDGYLGIAQFNHRKPTRGMELYEWYYLLHGLLSCEQLLDREDALQSAVKLGRFIIERFGAGEGKYPLTADAPGTGHAFHRGTEGTLILELIALLYQRSGRQEFLEWAIDSVRHWDQWVGKDFYCWKGAPFYTRLKKLAAGEIGVHQIYDQIHAHTLHMNLLGLWQLYCVTGNAEYRDIVVACVEDIAANHTLITGAPATGELYHDPCEYSPMKYVEVCPMTTWMLLNAQLLRHTGRPVYAERIERILFNHFLAAQLADGSNWSYFTPTNGISTAPASPNCCNSSGQRLLSRVPTFIYGTDGQTVYVWLYSACKARITLSGGEVTLTQKTDFPQSGNVEILVEPTGTADFELALRIPQWCEQPTVEVNGTPLKLPTDNTELLRIRRTWTLGDKIDLRFPMKLWVRQADGRGCVGRGPMVYAMLRQFQPPEIRQPAADFTALVLEQTELLIDAANPTGSFSEAPTPEGCTGPALSAKARVAGAGPIFLTDEANVRRNTQKHTHALLLPFYNQGVKRDQYQIFWRIGS